MIFGSIVASPRGSLSPLQALNLAKVYLENARKETDGTIMLVLCHDTEVSLLQARRAAKHAKDNAVSDGVAVAYIDLGKFLYSRGRHTEAQASFKKAQKLGVQAHDIDQLAQISRPTSAAGSIKSAPATTVDAPVIKALPPPDSLETATPDTTDPSSLSISLDVAPSTPIDAIPVTSVVHLDTTLSTTGGQHIHDTDTVTTPLADIATVPLNIFVGNVRAPTITFKPPEVDERLNDTLQLACSLGLLQAFISPDDILDPAVRNWLQVTQIDTDEQERLKAMATDVIRAFKRDELKDVKAVAEVVYLSPVLEKEDFQYLLREFYSGIDQSGLLNVHQLEGLAQLIQGAKPGYLEADDLVKILQLLSTRLQDTHRQSPVRIYKLTLAVSHVLDAMADAEIKDLDRERLHEPLSLYLDGMKRSSDTYLVYQAAYAYQALLCVPDDETLWQATLRRSGKVVQGVSRLMSAVKGLDLNGFIEGLKDIQGGLAGASEVARIVKDAYDGARSLAEGGQRFLECIKEGFSFSRKCAWYPALRGADILIREGQFAKFRKLVCEAPCRRDQAFQWGVCQRLGDIAVNPILDIDTRRSAIEFLGEIYQNDGEWGQHTAVKQWVLEILMQLSSFPMDDMHCKSVLDSVLQELGKGGDAKKQALYRTCREDGYGSYPLEVVSPSIGSPSLLDRVQERLDVEGVLRQLKKQRLKARRNAIYIPPQAKPNLQASEESRFSLMEAAKGSLANKEQVFLVLGDSGSGKSTFSRELECQLWHEYKKNGPIPLHINLPAIDKPEHDMIAKQLRKAEFTEPQIRELKLYRRFILICDGYDESQQTHNLYTSNRLNEPGEWSAKMVISCRSEYLGVDYRDRFQPGDRNQRSEAPSLQEAVITPFSLDQVQEYIDQYVSVNRPLWETNQYKQALDGIPSLKELVKNPFLMALSLEVLPRMVDPGQNLSATRITRVALYDQFIEHWLERGKKRIGEKNMGPQARSAFENLIEEGFTQNGVNFLKRLSVAIHKYQDGQPIVQYTHYKDSTSWKAEFFSREEDNQLLREACPLIRNGNQHRFIHRSLLEYGLALAVFDPQELKGTKAASAPSDRRASVSSDASFVLGPTVEVTTSSTGQEPDLNSPLIWRSFVNDLSILQFLEERVQQEPMFKKQLLDYIDFSKTDKKFRTAAANAITILVRAGMQFNYADLRGIKIPGADISYGFFDSAQLQEADLRHVNLRGACMPQANLSNAQMSGVQFGELPYLPQESKVVSTKYSPDGKSFAVGLDNGGINVYATSNWTIMWKSKEHSGKVLSISYSPTRNQIASSSEDKTLRLWDETGVCRHLLIGHEAKVNCIAHSVQGGLIASAGYDRTIRLWDTATGDCKSTLKGHDGNVADTVFSPKGNQLATCSWDATIRLWDVESGVCTHTLSGHTNCATSIVYSPHGDQIASTSWDKTLRLWNTQSGECTHTLTGHSGWVNSAMYTPKGDQLASASEDRTVRLWDVQTGSCRHILTEHHDRVKSVAYSPRGDQLATASQDGTVRLWDPETGACLQTLSGHGKNVTSVIYSPKGDQVASYGDDMTVRLWDINVGISSHASSSHSGSVWSVHLFPSGAHLASCRLSGAIQLWDMETRTSRLRTLTGHIDHINWIDFSPKGHQIASAGFDRTVRLWDIESGECRKTLTGHTNYVLRVVYSPNGDQLASCSGDNTTRLWDVDTGTCTHTLIGHERPISKLVYSPQGCQLASASRDKTVRIWNAETGECLHTLEGHIGAVEFLMYSPDGNQLASCGTDMAVRLWDAKTGVCCHVLTDGAEFVKWITYSPRGGQLATASDDHVVRLWAVETGACSHIMTGHSARIHRTEYSPQGNMLASASGDMSIRIWDTSSGQCQAVFQDNHAWTTCIDWGTTFDGTCLFAGYNDGSVRMWRVVDDGDHCDMRLIWRSSNGELNLKNASVDGVKGLSPVNKQLLEQRGVVGEPVHHFRDAGNKVIKMASVVSHFQSTPSTSVEQSGQHAEQTKEFYIIEG